MFQLGVAADESEFSSHPTAIALFLKIDHTKPQSCRGNTRQVADVLTYIRNSWGNSASAVDAETSKSSVKPWSSAAIDRVLGEIDHPNNRKHDHDRGDAEAKHKPDIMPDRSLPGLSRRYH